jgi:hypothetical protein
MTVEQMIAEILEYRDHVSIFRDEEDGTWFADALDWDSARQPRTPHQNYSHYLDSTIQGLWRMVMADKEGV